MADETEPAGLEELSSDSAATRLHYDADGGHVWLDTDVGKCDGLTIGVGTTRALAIEDARRELLDRVADLERASHGELPGQNRDATSAVADWTDAQREGVAPALIRRDLAFWLRESVIQGYLFGCHDEPLDESGKRVVWSIIDRLTAVFAKVRG